MKIYNTLNNINVHQIHWCDEQINKHNYCVNLIIKYVIYIFIHFILYILFYAHHYI